MILASNSVVKQRSHPLRHPPSPPPFPQVPAVSSDIHSSGAEGGAEGASRFLRNAAAHPYCGGPKKPRSATPSLTAVMKRSPGSTFSVL